MATVAVQAAGFETVLSTIATARAFSEQPNEINPTVTGSARRAVVYPIFREIQYDQAFDGGAMYLWDIVLLAAPASNDAVRGQQAIDPYLERTGDSSIVAALYANRTLNGACDDLKAVRGYDRGIVEVNNQNFWGAKVEVLTYD